MIYEPYIRVLYIDLDKQKIHIKNREDLMEYIGGVGIASKLLEENMHAGLPALDPRQPIVFAIGALSTVFPVMTKTVAMFISPLTGELGESYAGGRMAMTLFLAGYDALVITGRSKRPVYLSINQSDVAFRDARALWNLNNDHVGRIIREREPGGGKRSIIRIGQAGENEVSFASVCVDTYRHFGRLGLGAVFGSKQLKAISIIGDRSIHIRNFKKYFKVFQDIYRKCTDTEMMSKYHDAGTPINIEPLNAAGGLPTRNLAENRFEHAEAVSGETFAKNHLVRKMACTGCPVGCIHIGQFRREFASHGHEYEAISVGYDYELIYALGTMLGIASAQEILELIEEVELYGLDAMSTGVALAWAEECLRHVLITLEDTIVPLKMGDCGNFSQAIGFLSARRNSFYDALAKGVRHASSVYGGQDFAMHIAGNEMPGYHTGYGSLVGAAVGARHSHLCNGGYSIDQSKDELDEDELVSSIFNEEVDRCMLNSLCMCLFARKVYDKTTILSAMDAIGMQMDQAALDEAGRKILQTKLRIKKKLGFKLSAIQLPKRFFQTPSMRGVLEEETAYRMIKKYRTMCDELMAEAQA